MGTQKPVDLVREVVSACMRCADAPPLRPASRLREDLGLDSVDLMEIAVTIEERLGLGEMDQDDVGIVETLGDVEDLVRKLTGSAGSAEPRDAGEAA